METVLGPLLFIMYTTPLSSLISSLSLNHHLYADDTELFFSFHPPDVHSSLTHLHGALQQISSWMTSNLLTLNSSKTEFLFIGLKQQLAKLQNISLNTTHSARNLGFIFDENLTFSDQISSLSRSCYYHIRQLRCIRSCLTLTSRQPTPSPLLLYIQNSITVTVCTLTFLKPRWTDFSTSRTPLLALSLTHLNTHTSPLFSNLFTG